MTAHIASPPFSFTFPLPLPLSPTTSPPMPLSIIPKSRLWKTLFKRWFFVFALDVLRSVRMV